jgi:hypothetical protein
MLLRGHVRGFEGSICHAASHSGNSGTVATQGGTKTAVRINSLVQSQSLTNCHEGDSWIDRTCSNSSVGPLIFGRCRPIGELSLGNCMASVGLIRGAKCIEWLERGWLWLEMPLTPMPAPLAAAL